MVKLITNHFGEQSSYFSVPKVLMTTTTFLKKTETSLKIIKSYQRSLTISMKTELRVPQAKKPMASNLPSNCLHDEEIDHIIRQFNNHPSILKIKEKHPCPSVVSLSNATEDDILRILLSRDASMLVPSRTCFLIVRQE